MKKILTLLFLIFCLCFSLQTKGLTGTLDLATYFPSPQGTYDRLRIIPQDSPLTTPCLTGSLAVEKSGTSPDVKTIMQVCNDIGNGTGAWSPLASAWTQKIIDATTANLYLSDTDRTINVGIGTENPQAHLDIQTSIDSPALSLMSNYSAEIEFFPNNDPTARVELWTYGQRLGIYHENLGYNSFFLRTDTGRVGIGMTTPAHKLDVLGDVHAATTIDAGDDIRANDITTTGNFTVNVASTFSNTMQAQDLHVTGNFTSNSDIRITGTLTANGTVYASDVSLKKDIQTITNPLAKTMALRGVTFQWKKNDQPSLGFIAQEVEKTLPDLVKTNKKGQKGVEYGNIVALLTESLKAQQTQIDQLTTQINGLITQYESQ